MDRFFAVRSGFLGACHNRQPVAVAVRPNLAKKPDRTGPLNTIDKKSLLLASYFISNSWYVSFYCFRHTNSSLGAPFLEYWIHVIHMLELHVQSSASQKMQYIGLDCRHDKQYLLQCSIYETPHAVSFENEFLELIVSSQLEIHVQSCVSPEMWYIGLDCCYKELYFAHCSIYEKLDRVCFDFFFDF